MEEAETLRRKAKRALRLAEALSDQYSTQALKTLAATILEQAERREQGAQTGLSVQNLSSNSRVNPRKKNSWFRSEMKG